MSRPCESRHALDPKGCRLCWLSVNDARYRELWGISKPPVQCPELGAPLNPKRLAALNLDLERCGCLGKVRECGIHGYCTTGDPRNGIQCCLTCPDRPGIAMEPLKWAYGVTTCLERRDSLLPGTLRSLASAGFPEPHLFVDGDDGKQGNWPIGNVTRRYPAVMVAKHWVLSLYELYTRNPHADRYALFQDDLLAYRNLRQYLEQWFPAKGYCNLYLFPSYQLMGETQGRIQRIGLTGRYTTGWFEAPVMPNERPFTDGTLPQWGKSAMGLVFDRAGVLELLKSDHLLNRPQDGAKGLKTIDGAVVAAMNKAGYREYAHWPSLLQHTGDVSSIRSKHAAPFPHANTFRGADYNALELLREVEGRVGEPAAVG